MYPMEHIWTIVMLEICKHTFYAYLSQIWKMMQFTGLIRKVFATKILLSGKFSPFLTLKLALIFNFECLPFLRDVLLKKYCRPFGFCYLKLKTQFLANGWNATIQRTGGESGRSVTDFEFWPADKLVVEPSRWKVFQKAEKGGSIENL